jgi:hypothetical protein
MPGASRHRPFGRFVTSSSGMRMLHQHHIGGQRLGQCYWLPLSFASPTTSIALSVSRIVRR